MAKGKIIFYDDQPEFTSQFEALMQDSDFEIISFTDLNSLRGALNDEKMMYDTKALIFDLARNQQESTQTRDFEILNDIDEKFNRYRIPIFIHSAFASEIPNFADKGTVWKVDKSGTSLSNIVDILSHLDKSGFIEAFTPGGIIEQSLMQELHKNFTEQFRKGEIEKIIFSLQESNPDDYRKRSIEIFKRIAIKALMTELLTPVASNGDTVNPIEHFYRRSKTVPVWTGDIWGKNDGSEIVIILSPRCDLANGKATLLVLCDISQPELNLSGKKEERRKQLQNYLTDNLLGKATRYLPSTPMFAGGMVYLSRHKTLPKDQFLADYHYIITVSDDLTNELIGKFAYYFLRTGITTMNTQEFDSYLALVKKEMDGKE